MPINLRQAYTEIPGNVPGVEAAIQVYRGFEREITEGENRFKELDLIYSDTGFFFTSLLCQGDAAEIFYRSYRHPGLLPGIGCDLSDNHIFIRPIPGPPA
jgi:hypothetical protein